MKLFNLLPFIVFIFYCCPAARAQEYSYKHYDIKDGLVGNNVYQVAEDKEGFLWFATETGVSRFDGTAFKNFTTAEGLPDNEILGLFVDSKARVWMMPFKKGICYYYKGKIYNGENDPELKKISIKERIIKVTEDKDGNLFLFENTGIIVIKKDGSILYKYEEKGVNMLFFGGGIDADQHVFTYLEFRSHPTTIFRVIVEKNNISLVQPADSVKFWGNKFNFSYINSQVYVYSNNIDRRENYAQFIFNYYKLDRKDTIPIPNLYNTTSFLNDSTLFFNTGHGSYLYNFYRHIYLDHFLTGESVSCTLIDNENNIWFVTLGHGIYRLRSAQNKNIFITEDNSRVSVEALMATESKIFIGSNNPFIYKLNKADGNISSFKIPGKAINNKTWKIQAHKGEIYFLEENFLVRSNAQMTNITPVPLFLRKMWSFKDMDINSNDEVFFATHMKGLYHSLLTKSDSIILPERCSSVCIMDSAVYFGTLTGLKYVDSKFKISDLGEKFDVFKNRITKLVSAKNNIWVGTNTNGVICYDGTTIKKIITINNGLTGNLVRALFADDKYLWVGTDRGLNKISLTEKDYPVLQTYTTSDGITSNMINAVCVLNDTVYIGTPEGLSFFNEKELNKNSICELRMSAITVSNRGIAFDSARIKLANSDNNIRFDFVAISYKSEGQILYYYKLSGIDTAWKTTKENFLQYPTLPSGVYSLQLYAVNKFGVISKSATIHFSIEKKLIEETWFIVCIILSGILIAWLLANWQIRRIKKSQQLKTANAEKIALLEQQALKAQMNPHFIFNCLNSIQQYVIDKDVQGANKFISGFSRLIRQTLDNSGKQSISVAEEESFLRAYLELEKSRFEDKFEYNISIDKNIQKDEDSLPPMLLQPYIENCIRHGIMHKSNGKGMIDIRFNLVDRKLVCSISDNGIGRLAANTYKSLQHSNHQSRGTDITGQRIKMINKSNEADIILKIEDLLDEQQQPAGTKVTIVIPLQQTDLKINKASCLKPLL